jgi:sialidase-1
MSIFRCQAMTCVTLAWAGMWSGVAIAADPAKGVSAICVQRVHPVLIRNEHNSLVQVVVDVTRPGLQAKQFTFSLRGTDDLADIDSLRLYYSGEKQPAELDQIRSGINFAGDRQAVLTAMTGTSFGALARPSGSLTFDGVQLLRKGRNVFWLSCTLRAGANMDHKLDAHCTEVLTSDGKVVPRDATPGIRKRIGFSLRQHYENGVHTSRIPALARTPKGTLLCVYDMRRRKRRDLQEHIDIGLNRSTDGGQTWEPVRVIMDMGEYGGLPQEQNGCSDPGIVVDQTTGEIFCAGVWMWGNPGKHQWDKDGSAPGFEIGKTAQFLMVRSRDDGRTWSKPKNMTRMLKKREWILLAPAPQQGLTLRDGTLVMLGEGRDAKDRMFSTLIVSRDHGTTWTVGSTAAHGNGECQAVQLDNGSLLLNARTARPTKFRSVWLTDDLGKTWRPHETHRKTMIEPNCNGSLCRFDYTENGKRKHVLLFANPHSQTGRDHHSIQVSFDEGRTWPTKYRLLLDAGRGNGYPSMTRVDATHVGLVYEGSQSHLVFEKLSLDELLKRRR